MIVVAARRAQIQRLAVLIPCFAALGWAFGWFLGVKGVETVRAGVILSLLVACSLVLFWRASRSDPRARLLFGILCASFALKLFAAYFRFFARLLADARSYSTAGRRIADQLEAGIWPDVARWSGTAFVELLTGLTYYIAGSTFYGISILWAWLGLLGMLLYYKAFRTALPDAHHRLYMVLIFLFPSVLLWTSSLGKDALVMLFGGLATYGFARLRWRFDLLGMVCLTLGAAGFFAVRPHIAAVYVAAVAVAFAARPLGSGAMASLARIVIVVTAVAVSIGVAVTAAGLIGVEGLEGEDVEEFFADVRRRTGERGGSVFDPVDISSPVGIAMLVPTILFRPFPWEAHNLNALIASMEGLALMIVIALRFRSVRTAVRAATRDSFLLMTLLYAVMFFYLYSAVANFGIIARQRVQIFPFVFMWVAYLGASRSSDRG